MYNLHRQLIVVLFLFSPAFTVTAAVRNVWQQSPRPSPPYTNWATAAHTIQDAADAAEYGDTVLVAGGVYATGGRAVFGTMTNRVVIDKAITVESLWGPEVTVIQGFQVSGTTNGDGAIRCVYLGNGALLSGFTLTSGATLFSANYQEGRGGGLWCMSTSARASNCVVTGNSAYEGGGAYSGTLINCTLSGNAAHSGGGCAGATLEHCTVSGNSATSHGGGSFYGILKNCIVTGNSALVYGGGESGSTLYDCLVTSNSASYAGGGCYYGTLNRCVVSGNSAPDGGGSYRGRLNNCVITGNYAINDGGGSKYDGLYNCTVTANSASSGGGSYGGTLNNCIVFLNTSRDFPDNPNYTGGTMYYCCSMPEPPGGDGNIGNTPLFVDLASGNLRLQSNSPCINAGDNSYVIPATDLDGKTRVVGGTVDMGAYEFQSPSSALSYAWLQRFNLPTDGSVDFADSDLDGHNNWQEWRTDTSPTNALSRMALLAPRNAPRGLAVTWQSVATRSYFLERGTNLNDIPAFLTLATDILGQPGTTTYTDTTATNDGPFFYRVGVE